MQKNNNNFNGWKVKIETFVESYVKKFANGKMSFEIRSPFGGSLRRVFLLF